MLDLVEDQAATIVTLQDELEAAPQQAEPSGKFSAEVVASVQAKLKAAGFTPMHANPAPVPLTDEQIVRLAQEQEALWNEYHNIDFILFARAIERAVLAQQSEKEQP